MLRILLLSSIFILLSSSYFPELQFKPEEITKKSILDNHDKIFDKIRENNSAVMAVISPEHPNGYTLTRKTAHLLTHISPTWFTVTLKLTPQKRLVDVIVRGTEHVRTIWMDQIRRHNKFIKIVPEFKFLNTLTEQQTLEILKNPLQAERIASALHSHCDSLGLDGLVLDLDRITLKWTDPEKILNGLETMEQIGKMLRKKRLAVVLALNPPQKTEKPKGFYAKLNITDRLECDRLSEQFDYVLLKTYEDADIDNLLRSWERWVYRSTDCFGDTKKVMIGINFHGYLYRPIDFERSMSSNARLVDGPTYLDIVSFSDAIMMFFEDRMLHTLVSKTLDVVVLYPSLVSLENRTRIAEELNMSIAFFDYGMGLDYFANILGHNITRIVPSLKTSNPSTF